MVATANVVLVHIVTSSPTPERHTAAPTLLQRKQRPGNFRRLKITLPYVRKTRSPSLQAYYGVVGNERGRDPRLGRPKKNNNRLEKLPLSRASKRSALCFLTHARPGAEYVTSSCRPAGTPRSKATVLGIGVRKLTHSVANRSNFTAKLTGPARTGQSIGRCPRSALFCWGRSTLGRIG